jgi:predicted CoA-substrate-specific enzyme activase
MRYVAGIDAGTGLTKAVILASQRDSRPVVVGRGWSKAGIHVDRAAQAALDSALADAGRNLLDICYVASTGFGRYGVSIRDIQITEITSGARGAFFLFPETSSVLDIGSQSTRAVSLKAGGKVAQFKTNDKCAAGSGSFIVRAAKYLQIELSEVGELALEATSPQAISSVCAVLAESEIINHVSAGVGVEDILRGIYDSLAERAVMLLKRAGSMERVTFIGGVARQRGMVRALEEKLGKRVNVPEHSEYVCATGAALLGLRRLDATSHNFEIAPDAVTCHRDQDAIQ